MTSADKKLLCEAQDQVEAAFPGIRLESAVQGYAYLGEFERGISAYGSLDSPTGADDRWLGVCFFQVFEDMRAQESFFRALAKGEEAARVNLAHLLRFLERSEEAAAELLRVDVEKLSPYDLVLYLRVSSLHEETNGNIRKAVEHAELAWERVQGLPEFQILAPSVLAQLGILYGRIGEARKALWYFDRGIRLTEGLENQKVRLRRATLLLTLGRFDEVESELDSLVNLPESLHLERDLLWGELLWSRGQVERAVETLASVVETAAKLASGSDEFESRLSLTAIFTALGNFSEASEHVSNARILISDKTDVLLHRYREILLHLESNQYGIMEAASELEMLAVEFRRLGTLQEEACVRLRLAELFRRSSDSRLQDQLLAIKEICTAVHNTAFLNREWVLLPELHQLVRETEPELITSKRRKLNVVTVGGEGLYLDGELVSLPIRRSVELLAYFLEHRQASLSKVLVDLFPKVKTRTARSYFHQFRHQLRRSVPGIEISFNQQKKVYELRHDVEITWDVEQLRNGESTSRTGGFLPSSAACWTAGIRREVRDLTRSVGVSPRP